MASMYSRAYKSSVSVYVDYFCVMNDQPERSNNLGLALVHSAYHKRMGYVMDYKQVNACEKCAKSIYLMNFASFLVRVRKNQNVIIGEQSVVRNVHHSNMRLRVIIAL